MRHPSEILQPSCNIVWEWEHKNYIIVKENNHSFCQVVTDEINKHRDLAYNLGKDRGYVEGLETVIEFLKLENSKDGRIDSALAVTSSLIALIKELIP